MRDHSLSRLAIPDTPLGIRFRHTLSHVNLHNLASGSVYWTRLTKRRLPASYGLEPLNRETGHRCKEQFALIEHSMVSFSHEQALQEGTRKKPRINKLDAQLQRDIVQQQQGKHTALLSTRAIVCARYAGAGAGRCI